MGIDREGYSAWDECGGIGSDGVATVVLVVVVVVVAAADDEDDDGRVGSCFLFFPKPKNDDDEVLLSIASLVLTTATFGGMYVPFNLCIHGGDTIVNHIAINIIINRSIKQLASIHQSIDQSNNQYPSIHPSIHQTNNQHPSIPSIQQYLQCNNHIIQYWTRRGAILCICIGCDSEEIEDEVLTISWYHRKGCEE